MERELTQITEIVLREYGAVQVGESALAHGAGPINMAGPVIQNRQEMTLLQKLEILSDAAKYDVSCSSSGVGRQGDGTGIGNTAAAGICHSFAGDGRCISLLKI